LHVTATSVEKVNGVAVASPEPRFDPVALAEAEAIRTRAAAEAEALRTKAAGEAKAAEILAGEQAEKDRLTNERARLALERKQVDHDAYVAKKAAETAKSLAEKQKGEKAEADQADREAQQLAEQARSERFWKWGARGIYAVGLIIAGPVQFMHFWDPKRPFLVAAPALLEGFALVLAFGATWAVAHRRDVAPYRVGIMLGAIIAAGVNLYGGVSDKAIGFNAGLIGAIGSIGGPIVLMAYEHGIAQKADGEPSRREKRAARKAAMVKAAADEEARIDKGAVEAKAAAEKKIAEAAAEAEQKRRDDDRRTSHEDVWEVADAMRSARGSQYVTEQIWADAWYRVTGCRTVGIRPEVEAQSRLAEARMRAVTDAPILGDLSLINSQKVPRQKKDPNTPDGRRRNGGIPPVRRPGDTQPYTAAAKKQAALEQASANASQKEQR
jgi:hypothetical protein